MRRTIHPCIAVFCILLCAPLARAADIIPPLSQLKPDHPRLLIRPNPTRLAIPLPDLRAIKHDADFNAMLAQLKKQDHAAAQAMVWLLTGDNAAADKAIARMRAYRFPGKVDTFHIYFRLSEFALAYDWLYNYPGFTKDIRADIRSRVAPLAAFGLRQTNDHMFHNYVWMSAGGVALWSLAIAGEDDASSALFEKIRTRFNTGLYPAWQYLDGLPSEPMGYWSLYVFSPGLWTLLASQSASETDLISMVRKDQTPWLDRTFSNLLYSILPDMRYIPWGDLQSGPNGGVTMEMAGTIDAASWALNSSDGRQFGQWLAAKRGLHRFYGDTAIFYMLYTRTLASHPTTQSAFPAPSFLAGNRQSGHFIARSSWDDDATIVAFTCTDHFGDHHHYDQGSFIIYRRGLLAVDPPVYRQVRGPQQKTENHNTLLIGGQPQRPVRGQWFVTVEDFKKNLLTGRKLETGDISFFKDAGPYAAVAGQFAQAYDCPQLQSCVRQLLFIRPDKILIVDRLLAKPNQQVPEIQWLLQLPSAPRLSDGSLIASNGKSTLRCRSLSATPPTPKIEPTPVNTHRATYTYPAASEIVLAHLLETADGNAPAPPVAVKTAKTPAGLEITIAGQTFLFSSNSPYAVVSHPAN